MNANEVIATLAARRLGQAGACRTINVNMSQSSNDVVPTAIHVAAALLLNERLLPALRHLSDGARVAGARVRARWSRPAARI